jgi:hypothetical protein
MDRTDLVEIIRRVIEKVKAEAPEPACIFQGDGYDPNCDITTYYNIGEEG